VISLGQALGVPRRVWGGTGWLVLGRLYGSACTLTIFYLLARSLDHESFGRLTFYLALFLVLDSLADLGTGQVVVQRTASDPSELGAILVTARRIRVATGLIGVVLMGGGAFLLHEPDAPWILLASFYPVTHALELSTVVFKNEISWGRPVIVRVIASSMSLAFVLLGIHLGWRDPGRYLVAVASGSTLGNVLLHAVSRRRLPHGPFAPYPLRPLLASALPMGVAGLCQQIYFYVDNLFVRAWVGEGPLGHYNIAVRIMSYGIMVPVYAALAAMPWLARENAAGRLGHAVTRLAQPMLLLGALATGVLWPWCEPILALFGKSFVDAAPSLRWLLLATFVVYAGAALVTAVVASGRARTVLAVAAVGLIVNLAANTWLVPLYGIEGSGMATFGTELAVAFAAAMALLWRGHSLSGRRRKWMWLLPPLVFWVARALSALLPIPVPA
jgi:O-antigen/teichoic acid export membrane protein